MGWFFGFKLHIVINDRGEIIDFLFTQANVDDREPLKNKNFHEIGAEQNQTKEVALLGESCGRGHRLFFVLLPH